MNSQDSKTFWISVVVACVAVALLYSWSQDQRSQVVQQLGAKRKVLVAAKEIGEMMQIEDSMLETIEVPARFIHESALSDAEQAVGQVASVPIAKGEPLMPNKITLPGARTGIALEISPGKRAFTIPVDDTRGVSKLLKPGDRVDIVAAIDSGKGADQKREVKVVLQDVPILATGVRIVNNLPRKVEADASGALYQTVLTDNTNFGNIVIEAKPEEAQMLIYILSTSPQNLFLTLRHPNDRYIQPQRSVTQDDVLGRAGIRIPSATGLGGPVQPTLPGISGSPPGN